VHGKNRQLLSELAKARHIRDSLNKEDINVNNKKKIKSFGKEIEHLKQKKLLEEIKKEVHDEVYRGNLEEDKLPEIQNQAKIDEKEENIINNYFVNPIKTETCEAVIPQINSSNKPKWCLTKKEAEELEEKELDDLLNFAKTLDFQKYIKNVEIREAMYLIKNKVENTELAVNKQNSANDANLENEIPNNNYINNSDKEKKEVRNLEEAPEKNRFINFAPVIHDKEWDNNTVI